MYWVEVQDGIITGRGQSPALTDGQIGVSEEIFNQVGDYRAEFEMDGEGNIISVTPIPRPPEPPEPPEPPTQDERLAALEAAMLELVLGGAD